MAPSVSTWILFLTGALLLTGALVSARCRFPKEWKGRWYQSGLGDIIIRSSSMQRKGNCIEHRRDYYLLENEDEKCYQCLLMMKRHRNIIQYKESYCMPAEQLHTVCSMIRVDSLLHTLVREPTTSIPPPFEDSYKVNYNDGVSGECEDPLSTAKPCPGQDKVNFHFEHCNSRALWHETDLSFEVLATWKDGSDMYMYGKFDVTIIGDKDSAYRCFKYEHYGSDLYMAMSVDATCLALRSPRDGPITMHFTKDVNGRQQPICSFPAWVAGTSWSDLADNIRYAFDDSGTTMSTSRNWGEEFVGDEGSTEELQSQTGCLGIHVEDYRDTAIVTGFSTEDCNIRYQCLKFERLANGVVALYEGAVTNEYSDVHHCRRQLNRLTDYKLLIDLLNPLEPEACPMAGQYHLPEVADNCDVHVDMGCRNHTYLDFLLSCSPDNERLSCLRTWSVENSTYVMVQNTNPLKKPSPNCWAFTYVGHQLRLDTEACNRGAISTLPYTLSNQKLFKTDCDGTSNLATSKEPERIIIDRDQIIESTTTSRPYNPHRPPDPSAPVEDRDTVEQAVEAQDSMYRTSNSQAGNRNTYNSFSNTLLLCLCVLAQLYSRFNIDCITSR